MVDIVQHVVAAESDMTVVGVVDDGDLPDAIRRTRADVVVTGHDAQSERDLYRPLLLRHPRVKVLAIADDGKSASLYDLQPRRGALGKISARTLAKAIRGSAPPGSETPASRKRPAGVH